MNKLAGAVTKRTKACDKRLARLNLVHSSHKVNTDNIVLWETQHSNADLDYFKTLILQEISKTQKSTSGGVLCIFGSHTFVCTDQLDVL